MIEQACTSTIQYIECRGAYCGRGSEHITAYPFVPKTGVVSEHTKFRTTGGEALSFAASRYFVNEIFAGDSKEKGTQIVKDRVNPLTMNSAGL